MRNFTSLYSFAVLAIAGASNAPAATVDPNNDFDCATAFQYSNNMAVAKQLGADLEEQTLLLNTWFADKWNYEHPGEAAKQIGHYGEVLKALVNDPKGAGETLKLCIARANADPRFPGFVTAFRKNRPKSR